MNAQFKKGVLEMIVLMIVNQKDIYGYELVKQICDVIEVKEGTVYPLLKRMTQERYFQTYLKESTEGPPRKYYHITAEGVEALKTLKTDWMKFSRQISQFVENDLSDNCIADYS